MNRPLLAVVAIIICASLVASNMMMQFTDGGPQTLLSIGPGKDSVNVGKAFVVSANISCVSGLKGWKMDIRWDPSIIELDVSDALAVEEGGFFKAPGITTIFSYSDYVVGSGNLSTVKCYINQTQSNGVTGSGTLLWLRFKAVGAGTTLIEFSDSKLFSSGAVSAPITHNRAAGNVTVESIPTNHDIAVEFNPPSNLLKSSQIMLNGTVRNLGNTAEHRVNLSLYVDNSQTNTTEIAEIAAGSPVLFEFPWMDATEGSHNVTVYASPVAGESNSSNNVVKKTIYVGTVVLHDLAISFEPALPRSASLGDLVYIDAIVQNNGTSSEENLEAAILVNSQQVNRSVIRLAVGESYGLSYQLNIRSRLSCNVTAFVTTVTGEVDIDNNRKEASIQVVDSSERLTILVVSDDDGGLYDKGTCLDEFELALTWSGRKYDVWRESTQGRPSIDVLLRYESIIWTAGDYRMTPVDRYDVETLEAYLSKGGNLLMEGQFIAFENPPNHSNLQRSILHINLRGSNLRTEGLTMDILDHVITRSLPSNLTWKSSSTNYSDAPVPYLGAYSVIRFTGTNFSAISVFDGTQEGVGSVIYCSFALRWLDENWSNLLVANCVNWLTRSTISTVGSRIINSALNSMHFVYPYPTNPDEESGIPSGSMIYGLVKNPQKQSFDTPQECVFLSSVSNTTLALFGRENHLVDYFESTTALPPIRHSFNSNESVFLSREGNILASVRTDDVISGNSDLFAIYTFRDSDSSNTFFVMYGFSWRGMWAAEAFFANVISKNFSKYSYTFCVFLWVDSNSNGIPELNEIILKSSG